MPMFNKVLLIDDDPASNFLNSEILADLHAAREVEAVEDGYAACRLLKNGSCPDIIFLDIRMPGMSGFDFLESLDKQHLCENTWIIILSSSNRKEDMQRALGYKNVRYYFEKPLTEELLIKISGG